MPDLYLRLTSGAQCAIVDSQNHPLDAIPRVVRGVPLTLDVRFFANASATATMTAAQLPASGWYAIAFHSWEDGVAPRLSASTVAVQSDGAVRVSFAQTNTEELAALLDSRQGAMLTLEVGAKLSSAEMAALIAQCRMVADNRGPDGVPEAVQIDYYTKAQVNALLEGKQDELTAGDNITIVGSTISATIPAGQQSDWAETSPNAVSYIWNKPDMTVYATVSSLEAHANNSDIHVTAEEKDAWNDKITAPAAPVTGQYLRKTASGWDTAEVTAGVQDVQMDGQSVVSGGTASISTSALVHKFTGSGAPTTETVGAVGDLYTDTATNYAYECISVAGSTYTWRKLGAEYLPLSGVTTNNDLLYHNSSSMVTRIAGGAVNIGFNTNIKGDLGSLNVGYNISKIAGVSDPGKGASAFGQFLQVGYACCVTIGKYNVCKNIPFHIGNGASSAACSNALEVTWQGGIRHGITAIPAATSAHPLTEGVSTHAPSAPATYTLPAVEDSTVTHEVVLYLDLTATASFTFQTEGGTGIVPKMSFTPAVGDKVTALCRWEFGAWQVYLVRTEEASA